jgi:hypothetical protein
MFDIDVGYIVGFVESRNENVFSEQCFEFECLQSW